ncbi:hypothetical protein BRADI_3g32356v3 [Brachypodium distachyon]|uniref:Uncharacterized protein n=1 Tax=Brachypodium distachyon TaxID=15368 RepID=A0A0Q3IBH0_BRADI|nr:hypothetical protein BRADI_3g32356v3 [Brachypodium distachyon]
MEPADEKHRPWKTLENTVRAIIDHTFDTALCIVKMTTHSQRGSSRPDVVDLEQFIDPADKDSPVLTVHAEATSCCFAFNNSRRDAAAYARYTSKSGKSAPTHRFRDAAITISPGTLHLAHAGVVGRTSAAAGYSGVSPDVGSSSSSRPLGDVLAMLDAVVQRLDEEIWKKEAVRWKAKALPWCGYRPSFPAEIEQVLKVLREMRSEMDIEAVMRRRLQKRRRCVVQEIGPVDAVDRGRADMTAEELAKRLKRMEIGSSSSL